MAALADRQLDTPSTGSIGTRTERNSEGAKSMSTGADALKRPYRPTRLGPEVVTPLSGPAHVYGPSGVAKARWRKPLPAIIADAMTNSHAVIARLERGMYMPDMENTSHYQAVFNTLLERTRLQLQALEAFSAIEWSALRQREHRTPVLRRSSH